MYTIEQIFEYMWSVEADRFVVDSRSVEDLVNELNDIKKEIQ